MKTPEPNSGALDGLQKLLCRVEAPQKGRMRRDSIRGLA